MQRCTLVCALVLASSLASAGDTGSPLPSFSATSLTGKVVTEEKLIGQPTILIVTPSKAAAADTRKWVAALRSNIDPKTVRVRDVLAIDLPFFMSERDAIGRAKEKIPRQYHDQTWLLAESSLEQSLNIPPSSEEPYILVLDKQGKVATRVQGRPTARRIDEIEKTVARLAD